MHVYKLNRLSHNSTDSKQSISHRFQHRSIGWLAAFSLIYVLVHHFCQLHNEAIAGLSSGPRRMLRVSLTGSVVPTLKQNE